MVPPARAAACREAGARKARVERVRGLAWELRHGQPPLGDCVAYIML